MLRRLTIVERLNCTIVPPILQDVQFWFPYFKIKHSCSPILIFFALWSHIQFFTQLATKTLMWQEHMAKYDFTLANLFF
jgi:hypothetical protein